VSEAHAAGLVVHPYTFRKDELPGGMGDFHALLDLFLGQLEVDGVFTDFPDIAAAYVESRVGS
jgi:glycerophosphoryl diester phosphodiesterase